MTTEQLKELNRLLNALREDVITDEQFEHLDQLISTDKQACRIYVDFMKLWADLQNFQLATQSGYSYDLALEEEPIRGGFTYTRLWQSLADFEKEAPAILIEKPIHKPEELRQGLMKIEEPKREISRFSIYTLALSAAAMLFLMILVLSSPIRPVVATLTDSINAEWVSEDEIPAKWDVLRQGELTLTRGLAEITFKDGAVVIVEAPAIIELESPKSMFLTSGKISAVVSEYATGFTVNTFSASIVDLGTEFGVSVGGDGSCSLHMFKGKANLIAGRKGQKRSSQVINANEARSIDPMSDAVRAIRLSEKCFVRRIDSEKGIVWRGESLNLADIVNNGDGFGSKMYAGCVNLNSGDMYVRLKSAERRTDNKYHSSEEIAFVDGVFVPDGGSGSVQTTSAGHVWEDCPDTTGIFYEDIYTGSSTRVSVKHCFVLEGIYYGTPDHPAIVTHTNAGISFDLTAIRSSLSGLRITGFESLCGVSEEAGSKYPGNVSDFYVLVDGEKRFEAKAIGVYSEPVKASVELSEEDRFLTLVSTDGDLIANHDWSFFAEPKLVLE